MGNTLNFRLTGLGLKVPMVFHYEMLPFQLNLKQVDHNILLLLSNSTQHKKTWDI